MDNKNQNNGNNPFGTIDWSKTYGEPSNKPKDITSDMWTPISTGIPVRGTQSSVLTDEQNKSRPAEKAGKASSVKQQKKPKKKAPAAKNDRGRLPSKKGADEKIQPGRPVISGMRNHPDEKVPPRKRKIPIEELERRQQKHIAEKEKRAMQNDRKKYEKAQADYRTKISSGHSSNDVRRKKARKKKRNKKLIAVILVCAIMIAAGAFAAIYFYMYGAPVQNILVEGKSKYSNAEIVDASGILKGNSMLQIREKTVNKAISTKLPYVKSVKVDYQLPDTVSLEVTPTAEKYLIAGTKGYICIDGDGKILSLKKQKIKDGQFKLNGFEDQPAVVGDIYSPENDNAKKFETAKKIISLLEENKIDKGNVLFLGDLNDIIVEYDSRINIYIGNEDRLSEKLGLASKVILQEAGQHSIGYIEARYESRVFYKEGSKTIS